ncbi:hypothetical protein BR93DRAFT_942662 [Coniochaeta sp. PMI_546]|nr:hypothetical protein BR93DRAFT_942662 [Coniochaeta sp. PMI_546]
MAPFSHLVRFECHEDGSDRFSDLGPNAEGPPASGTKLVAFGSFEELCNKTGQKTATVRRLGIPSCPPLWTKPSASLAHPGEAIPINNFCARSLPDYEANCKDVSVKDAKDYILGYTVGNDLSCRMYQLQKYSGGQFFFAKGFDKFAPIGPTLISPEIFGDGSSFSVVTRVNGEVRQKGEIHQDMIFAPAAVLSHMSQGTTIPAGTVVMTGTPAGVGAFRSPKTFLKDGDVVEVEMRKVGTLSNRINLE